MIVNNNVVIFLELFTKGPLFSPLAQRGRAVPWAGAAGTARNRLEPAGTGGNLLEPAVPGGAAPASPQPPALRGAARGPRRRWKAPGRAAAAGPGESAGELGTEPAVGAGDRRRVPERRLSACKDARGGRGLASPQRSAVSSPSVISAGAFAVMLPPL